jgi:hypothetical protein
MRNFHDPIIATDQYCITMVQTRKFHVRIIATDHYCLTMVQMRNFHDPIIATDQYCITVVQMRKFHDHSNRPVLSYSGTDEHYMVVIRQLHGTAA